MAIEYQEIACPGKPDRAVVYFPAPRGVTLTTVDRDTILSWVYSRDLYIDRADSDGLTMSSDVMSAEQIVARVAKPVEKYFTALERLASAAA